MQISRVERSTHQTTSHIKIPLLIEPGFQKLVRCDCYLWNLKLSPSHSWRSCCSQEVNYKTSETQCRWPCCISWELMCNGRATVNDGEVAKYEGGGGVPNMSKFKRRSNMDSRLDRAKLHFDLCWWLSFNFWHRKSSKEKVQNMGSCLLVIFWPIMSLFKCLFIKMWMNDWNAYPHS